jgi:hypothetical protein
MEMAVAMNVGLSTGYHCTNDENAPSECVADGCTSETPRSCTWTFNGATENVCCAATDTCATGLDLALNWHAICCPADRLYWESYCCPEGTHPLYIGKDSVMCQWDSCNNGEQDVG